MPTKTKQEKRTIYMLSWEYPPRLVGGISRHVQELSRALVKRGERVEVITAPHENTPIYENDEGVHVHRVLVDLDTSDFLAWVDRLNHHMEAEVDALLRVRAEEGRTDEVVIHAHDWLTAQAAKNLKLKHKLPMVATIHATEYGRNHGLHSDLNRTISAVEWDLSFEAWRVIACSYYMRDEISFCFQTPHEKMDVIPNGIDAGKFDHEFDREAFRSFYAAPNEKIVFFVGRMVREKGAAVLVDAFARVLERFNDAKLVIAGGGHREHLVRQADGLGIGNRVYFTGYVDDQTLIRLYLVADVAVFPSLYEPFGIVALEAMAAGTPVVVSDAGGLREVVSHGVDGISTWLNNPDSLAWGILQSLGDPESARKMAANAKNKVHREFSWDRIAAMTQDTYNRVGYEFRESGWNPEAIGKSKPSGKKQKQAAGG